MQQIPYFRKHEKTVRCTRCTKKYAENLEVCPYCADVKDGRELEELKLQHQMELKGSTELGKYFIAAALVFGVFIILVWLL